VIMRIAALYFMSFWIAFSLVSTAQAATQMEDLENALMCKCDDKCGKVLINCTCDTSKETRKHLMSKLESGLTVKQIIKTYVDKHGETILSAPSKRGFNLTAWLTPFVALVIGGFGVRKVIQTWTRKSGVAPIEPVEPAAKRDQDAGSADRSLQNRLQDELDQMES